MKRYVLVFCLVLAGASCYGARRVVDEIVVKLHDSTSEKTDQMTIITRSAASRLSLQEQKERSLRDCIVQRLEVASARKNMPQKDTGGNEEREVAEELIDRLVKENHLPRTTLMASFGELGYTEKAGITELYRIKMSEQAVGANVMADRRMMIEEPEVKEYDDEHPEYLEASCSLAECCLPPGTPRNKQFTEQELAALAWEKPLTVLEKNLADDRRDRVLVAKVGDIVEREEVAEGLLLTRLVERLPHRRRPLDEKRYHEIEAQMHAERFKKLLGEYESKLLSEAESSLYFFHPEDRQQVFEAPSPTHALAA